MDLVFRVWTILLLNVVEVYRSKWVEHLRLKHSSESKNRTIHKSRY